MTDGYFAEGDYLRQASWLIVILMAEVNRRITGNRISDGIPMMNLSLYGMDFRFVWHQNYAPAKIRVTDGVTAIGNDWVASYVSAKKTKAATGSFVKVTGNIEAFERDMLLLKIKRSN